MQIQAIQQGISELDVDAAVVGIYEGGVLPEIVQQLDQATGGGSVSYTHLTLPTI